MTAPLFQQILKTQLFSGLDDLEAAALFGICEQRSMDRGITLFHEGDPGDALYVVMEGHVDVLKKDPSGHPQTLATLSPGTALGEMSLLGGAPARTATVVTTSPVVLVRMPADRFCELVSDRNVAALKVVHNLAQEMSKRLMSMNDKLVAVLGRSKKKDEVLDFQRLLADWSF